MPRNRVWFLRLSVLKKGIIFDPFVTVFLVWSFDRVAKLYYLILECEKATVSINVTVVHATVPDLSNRTKPNKKPIEPNRIPIVRLGFGNRTKSNTYFAVSSIFEPIELI